MSSNPLLTILAFFTLFLLPSCSPSPPHPEEDLTAFFHAFQEGDPDKCALYTDHALGLGEDMATPPAFAHDTKSLQAWQDFLAAYNKVRQDMTFYIESSQIQGDQALVTVVLETRSLHRPLQDALDRTRPELRAKPQGQEALLLEALTQALDNPPPPEKEAIAVSMFLQGDTWVLSSHNPALWSHLEADIMNLTY